jgi:2-polyprenyl-6-methoxyphenol hydroxylase-like FAD-dependent oxidoreductase
VSSVLVSVASALLSPCDVLELKSRYASTPALGIQGGSHLMLYYKIFERSNFQNEIGAAITITPNGMRILQRFGLDVKAAKGVQNNQMRMVDPYTLQDQIVEDFRGVESDYGAQFMFFHRVDLHTVLKNMAVGDAIPGPPAVIRNGQRVKGVDCQSGKIELENGQTFEKDLIIIADGVHVWFYQSLSPSQANNGRPNSSTRLPKMTNCYITPAHHFIAV